MLYAGWFGKALGFVAALVFAPPEGAAVLLFIVLGLTLGHLLDMWSRFFFEKAARAFQFSTRLKTLGWRVLRHLGYTPPAHPFLKFTFCALGRIAKAGGSVKKDHIHYVEELMRQLNFKADDRRLAIAWFQEGKQSQFSFQDLGQDCAEVEENRDLLLQVTLECMCMCAWIDGTPDQDTHKILSLLAQVAGASQSDFAVIEGRIAANKGTDLEASSSLRKAYSLLNLSPSASLEDIKLSYRRLLSRAHPDKVAGRADPNPMQQKRAERKTRKLREAYELILAEGIFTQSPPLP